MGSIDLFLAVMDSRAESAQGSSAQQHRQGYSSTYFRALQAMRLSYDASAVVLAGAIAAAYAVAFLMTLLMSTFDVLTMVKDGNTDTADWIDLALADSEYRYVVQSGVVFWSLHWLRGNCNGLTHLCSFVQNVRRLSFMLRFLPVVWCRLQRPIAELEGVQHDSGHVLRRRLDWVSRLHPAFMTAIMFKLTYFHALHRTDRAYSCGRT